MPHAITHSLHIKQSLIIFRFRSKQLEVLAQIADSDENKNMIWPTGEWDIQNLSHYISQHIVASEPWHCVYQQSIPIEYTMPWTQSLSHHVTLLFLAPQTQQASLISPDLNPICFSSGSSTPLSHHFTWHTIQDITCNVHTHPQPTSNHPQTMMWDYIIQHIQQLSQSTPVMLRLLPPTFRLRHVRYLYNQIWNDQINPQAFKAWMRKTQVLQRVGPARYTCKSLMRKPWQIK